MKRLLPKALILLVGLSLAGHSQVRSERKDYLNQPLPLEIASANLVDLNGKKFKISDYRGKVVLINLWATWCGPCRADIPGLVLLRDQYDSDRLEIIGINIGSDPCEPEPVWKITNFAQQFSMDYRLAQPKETKGFTDAFYGVIDAQAIPASVLVDREGIIRSIHVGASPQQLDERASAVRDLLSH